MPRQRKKRIKTEKTLICKNCLEVYEISEESCNPFCSHDCYDEYKNRIKPNTRKKIIAICKECGKEFFKVQPNHTFCSRNCLHSDYKRKTEQYIFSGKYGEFLKIRFEIFKRDNFRCQYCGKNPKEDNIKLNIDHIIPRSKGGTDNPNNLTTSCTDCNLGKKDILLEKRELLGESLK